jgi:hypothetical protein
MNANKIEKFEDLIAWQKARNLTKRAYEITKCSGPYLTSRVPGKYAPKQLFYMSNIQRRIRFSSVPTFGLKRIVTW